MKRARDVRDQLVGLMERVELEMESSAEDHDAIKKVGSIMAVSLVIPVRTDAAIAHSKGVVTEDVHAFSWKPSLLMRT